MKSSLYRAANNSAQRLGMVRVLLSLAACVAVFSVGSVALAATKPAATLTSVANDQGQSFGPLWFGTQGQTATPGVASPLDLSDGYCSGWFRLSYSSVDFTKNDSPITWDFYITTAGQAYTGTPVEVTMPLAQVNGNNINPPYAPHIAPSDSTFHSSFSTYQKIGGGSGTIKSGDTLYMVWDIYSLDGSGNFYTRYVNCLVV